MKNLFLIIALIFATSVANAQSISATYAPLKNGTGIILESPQWHNLSLLASFDTGKYKSLSQISGNLYTPAITTLTKFGFGVKYNWFCCIYQNTSARTTSPSFDVGSIYKHSFELGAEVGLLKNFNTGLLYDVLNREARLTFTYKFKFKKKLNNR